ncbi:MAG: 4Fe-4S binding protein, partial [Erysipelotrichaceae bacterium]|nr:4Fe-4S binding protein [Erysipelotrichaceae bacterium]
MLNKDELVFDSYDTAGRQEEGMDSAIDYTTSFRDAHLTLTEEQVKIETARCLGCGASIVDENKCIGCGVCTTKCDFDAIHLFRDHPECTNMVVAEDKFKHIIPYAAKEAVRLTFGKKTEAEKESIRKHKEYKKSLKAGK